MTKPAKETSPEKVIKSLSAALLATELVTKEEIATISGSSPKKIKELISKKINSIGINEPFAVADSYVLGIVLDYDMKHILLMEKKRPSWQVGKFNGLGGKIEKNEIAIDAMIREFKEETGLDSAYFNWVHVGHVTRPATFNLEGMSYRMDIFAMTMSLEDLREAENNSPTDERLYCIPLNRQVLQNIGVDGLSWIVSAAAHSFYSGLKFSVEDNKLHLSAEDRLKLLR